MIIWLIWFSAVAWTTSKCEPPVNSYLPPEGGFANRPSQEYGLPGGNNQGQRPGSSRPGGQNQPQDSYSPIGQQTPRTPDSQYGPPGNAGGAGPQRSFGSSPLQKPNQGFRRENPPSQEYGTPSESRSNLRNNQGLEREPFGGAQNAQSPSSSYGSPKNQARGESSGARNNEGRNNGNERFGINRKPNTSYGTPDNTGGQQGGNDGGFRQNTLGNIQQPDRSYGPPTVGENVPGRNQFISQRPESSYGPPAVGSPQDDSSFGQGQRRQGSSGSGRAPSSSYSAPNLGGNTQQPSSSYGIPEFGGSPGAGFEGNTGGDSEEPAKYEFNYDVDDSQTGTLFGHSEQRDGDTAMGMYNVVLPDGRKQVVEYEAGRQGYKPQIRYEGGVRGSGDSSFGAGGRQGVGGQGYPKGGPSSGQRNSIADGYADSGYNDPDPYQQQSSLVGDNGYPSGGSEGFNDNGLNQSPGYAQQRGSQSGRPGGSGGNRGPSEGLQGGRGFSSEDGYSPGYSSVPLGGQRPQGDASTGYPSGGPQDGNNNLGGRRTQQGSNFSSSPSTAEGYPQGGPGNQGVSTFPGGNRSSGRQPGSGGESGYPSGGPNGPRGSGY